MPTSNSESCIESTRCAISKHMHGHSKVSPKKLYPDRVKSGDHNFIRRPFQFPCGNLQLLIEQVLRKYIAVCFKWNWKSDIFPSTSCNCLRKCSEQSVRVGELLIGITGFASFCVQRIKGNGMKCSSQSEYLSINRRNSGFSARKQTFLWTNDKH